MNNIEIEAIIL